MSYGKNPPTPPPVIITIDGPAGTGKSSVAQLLAERLSVDYLDTGAMYRAVAVLALDLGIEPTDGPALAEAVSQTTLKFDWAQQPPALIMGGRDISRRIRDLDVSAIVSPVAAQGEVRRELVKLQRRIAREHPRLISEGRDQGSAVFPDAPIRFYLDADVAIRSQRRLRQLTAQGKTVDEQAILADIKNRDHIDSTRADDPLTCPEGAIVVNTDDHSKLEVVDILESIVREHIPNVDQFA